MKLHFYTKLIYLVVLALCASVVQAQIDPPCTIPGAYLCDNLDAYTSGDALGPGASWWSTWSGTEGGSEDGDISSDYAYSGSNSALIPEGGTTDVLLLLGNQTSGRWKLEWQMLIPSGKIAYYNIQEDETPGVAWNMEVYFGTTTEGTGEFTVPTGFPTFSYPVGEWFTVRQIIDLDADQIDVFIDGVNVLADSYTGSIGAIDFYSASSANRYYLDDVIYSEITGEGCVLGTADLCDNIETYTAGETIGSFADWWTTWSGSEGGSEDGIVSPDQAYSGIHSMLVPEGGLNDVILKLGNLSSGTYSLSWYAYIPDGKTGYYNIQEDESPGIAWNLDTYFGFSDVGVVGTSGEGVVSSTAFGDVVPFTYPVGQWFKVEHIINLDDVLIDVYIDGVLVYSADYGGTQIGAVDFYSIDANNRQYIDDVLLEGSTGVVSTYYADTDDDTYGNAASSIEVEGSAPDGYVSDATDCDDTNAAVNPGATEVCNTIDDDCDTDIDEGVLITFYADADGDTYGDDGTTEAACDAPSGYVADNTDCDDSNAAVNPGATEITNSIDDDCDELIDENVAIQQVNGNSATVDIYPVPNNGNFTITITTSVVENMFMEIYTVAGERLFEQTLSVNTAATAHNISLKNYAAGFYVFKLTQGDALFVKQFVIE